MEDTCCLKQVIEWQLQNNTNHIISMDHTLFGELQHLYSAAFCVILKTLELELQS